MDGKKVKKMSGKGIEEELKKMVEEYIEKRFGIGSKIE